MISVGLWCYLVGLVLGFRMWCGLLLWVVLDFLSMLVLCVFWGLGVGVSAAVGWGAC